MDPLSAIGSVAGIIALGIQLSEILQRHISSVRGAPERLQQVIIELQATANGIRDLDTFLKRDHGRRQPVINQRGKREFFTVIKQCDGIFRKVTVLVAQAGRPALAKVDHFQRKMKQLAEINGLPENPERLPPLEIELSSMTQLAWPWRAPKIEQYLLSLSHLKQSLGFQLTVAILAEVSKREDAQSDGGNRDPDGGDPDEGGKAQELKDRLFYQHQELTEDVPIEDTGDNTDQPRRPPRDVRREAKELLQNWPFMSDGEIPSCQDLRSMGIILKGEAISPTHHTTVPVPISQRDLRELALTQANLKDPDVWDRFNKLPPDHQGFLLYRLPRHREGNLVYLETHHRYGRRVFERIRNVWSRIPHYARAANTIFIITAYRQRSDNDRFDRHDDERGAHRGRSPSPYYSSGGMGPNRRRRSLSPGAIRARKRRAEEDYYRHQRPSVLQPSHAPLATTHSAPRASAFADLATTTNYTIPAEQDKNALARHFLSQWTTIDPATLSRLAPAPPPPSGPTPSAYSQPPPAHRSVYPHPSSRVPAPPPVRRRSNVYDASRAMPAPLSTMGPSPRMHHRPSGPKPRRERRGSSESPLRVSEDGEWSSGASSWRYGSVDGDESDGSRV